MLRRATQIVCVLGSFAAALAAVADGESANGRAVNPVAADAKSIAAGKRLFGSHCAACHGAGGKGDGKDAADLGKDVPDLTDESAAKMSDEKLFRWISRGRKPMPGFEKKLGEQDRWHLVNYVRALSRAR
jgi:mono/diheme cytochrome c family protein